MTQAKSIDPKEFGKYHNMTRLETVVKNCEECVSKTVFVYMGKYTKPLIHVYQCLSCKTFYHTGKKLKSRGKK